MASERPILFSGPMVRAILNGRKTQTRRAVKPQPEQRGTCGPVLVGEPAWYWSSPRYDNGDGVHYFHTDEEAARRLMLDACPYGVPGDRLWVRETWCQKMDVHTSKPIEGEFWYRADHGSESVFLDDGDGAPALNKDGSERSPWIPSIHMPRWASRLTLTITDVRVERLKEISESDAEAEGFRADDCVRLAGGLMTIEGPAGTARRAFGATWHTLNAKRGYGWDVNPWVWALTFTAEATDG